MSYYRVNKKIMGCNMEKVMISLTSYPDRIGIVPQVIESLFAQTKKAHEIVLWLSTEEFPGKYEDLPEKLKCLLGKNSFHIEWLKDNLKSHKKYFYALQDHEKIVITVDDDMYYAPDMVDTLIESYRTHPYAISAREVHMIFRENDKIAPYTTWESYVSEYAGTERMDLCAVGVGGILYPPGCARERWFDKKVIKASAENQDDLWLKFNEVIDGIPIVYTGDHEDDLFIEGSQSSALYLSNMHGGENDICIQKLINEIVAHNGEIYTDWFHELLSIQEFIEYKSNFYKLKIEDIFSRYGTKDIYICGAGKYACILKDFITKCEIRKKISAFLVTKKVQGEFSKAGVPVREISEIGEDEAFVVICGVNWAHRNEMKANFVQYKYCEWLDVDVRDIVWLERLQELRS